MKKKLLTFCFALLGSAFSHAADSPATLGAHAERPSSTNNVACKAVSPETNHLATASGNGRLIVRRLGNNQILWSSYHCSASALAFSADGETLASAGRDRVGLGTIRLWNTEDGAKLLTFTNRQEQVRFLLFEESGCMLVSLDSGGVLECWNLSDGGSLWSHPGLGAVDPCPAAPMARRSSATAAKGQRSSASQTGL